VIIAKKIKLAIYFIFDFTAYSWHKSILNAEECLRFAAINAIFSSSKQSPFDGE